MRNRYQRKERKSNHKYEVVQRQECALGEAVRSGNRVYQDLHLTSDRNRIKLRRAIAKCRSIFLLATPKLAAGFRRNISG